MLYSYREGTNNMAFATRLNPTVCRHVKNQHAARSRHCRVRRLLGNRRHILAMYSSPTVFTSASDQSNVVNIYAYWRSHVCITLSDFITILSELYSIGG